MKKWKVVEDKRHWLEVVDTDEYKSGDGTAAYVKWDGCVHLVLAGSYIHICNLPDLIERLTEIRDMAKARGFEGYE